MPRYLLILLTALAPIIWGSTYLVTTELLPANHPFLAALLRVLPAGLILLVWQRVLPQSRDWLKIAVLGILNVGFFQAMLFVAAYRLPGGLAAILGAIQPLLVMVLMSLIAQNHVPRLAWFAGLLGIIGMVCMLYSPAMQVDNIGVIAALLGAVSMALGTFLSRYWKVNLPLLAFTGWQLFFAGLFILPIFWWLEAWPTMTTTNITGYVYLSLIGALLAYVLWFQGVKKLPAAIAASLGLLSPVTAFFLGWLFLGQSMTPLSIVGFVMILLSIFVVQKALSTAK